MAMTATTFLSGFKRVKAFIAEHPGTSTELVQAAERVTATFKQTYTADAFKAALGEDAQVPTGLEDDLTSALMLLNHERTLHPGS